MRGLGYHGYPQQQAEADGRPPRQAAVRAGRLPGHVGARQLLRGPNLLHGRLLHGTPCGHGPVPGVRASHASARHHVLSPVLVVDWQLRRDFRKPHHITGGILPLHALPPLPDFVYHPLHRGHALGLWRGALAGVGGGLRRDSPSIVAGIDQNEPLKTWGEDGSSIPIREADSVATVQRKG